jgi:UPF0042 nucleotide-binding protein
MNVTTDPPRVLLISGLSGGGKSVALNALEDQGFYCVDNLPAALLPSLADQVDAAPDRFRQLAIGVDARAGLDALAALPEVLETLPFRVETLFLEAEDDVLIRRYSETRRRHPLGEGRTLAQAIAEERRMLQSLHAHADHVIDTSALNLHQLRRRIWETVAAGRASEISHLVLESFAFKRGVPRDVDLVFDARCLPNPHWQPGLRSATGLERPVREYLEGQARVGEFLDDIDRFVRRWLPAWAEEQRSHLTVAIGCTGGRHRSVYLVDELATRWRADDLQVTTHHRELQR